MENYFKGSRICKYCDINMDIRDLDCYISFMIHASKNTEKMAKSTQCLSMKINIA